MTIDLHGHQQEPLFPTSITERQQMQEEHLDLLVEIAEKTVALSLDTKKRQGEISGLKKRAMELAAMLRASRPRK
jgi:hypothetical protein